MNKLSSAQIAEVLTDASTCLRKQANRITELQDELAARDQRGRVEKLAGEMHKKGFELDVDASELADRLEKAAEAGKLEVFEAAVNLHGPDMGTKLAQLNNDTEGSSSASSDLERFIVGAAG